MFLNALEGFERVPGDDENMVDGAGGKKIPKKRNAPKGVDWKMFPAVVLKEPVVIAPVAKRSSESAGGGGGKQGAKAASTFDDLSRGRDSIRYGSDFETVKSDQAKSDPEWDRLKVMLAKGTKCTAAEKREFAKYMEQFSNTLGIKANLTPEKVTPPVPKRAKTTPPAEERLVQEENIFLHSFMDFGGIDAEYIAKTIGISEPYIRDVFQKRFPCLFKKLDGVEDHRVLADGDYWNTGTVREFTIDALSRKTWKHLPRVDFAHRYWITTELLYDLLELLGLCLPAELAVHLDEMHCRVPFSHDLFHEMYRVCFQYKDELEKVGSTCYPDLTTLEEEGGALVKSRLGLFTETPFHWRLLRLLRERVFRWAVMSENHTFVATLQKDTSEFRSLLQRLTYRMCNGCAKQWEPLFLTDEILFHTVVMDTPMGIEKDTFTSYSFWIRSSAARLQTMVEYFHAFMKFNFAPKTSESVSPSHEQDDIGSFLGNTTEEGLGDIFFSFFLREDFEFYMDNEADEFDAGHAEFEGTLREVYDVCPAALRLVLGAHSLGMVESRPLFNSLFHLALHWNRIAPQALKFPCLKMAVNPHPDGAFARDSTMAWYSDVALCDDMKPLALLGTLLDKRCSQAEKCTRLNISAQLLVQVETFIASNLNEELGKSLRLYIEPIGKGSSEAVRASSVDVREAAVLLAGFQAGSMFRYCSRVVHDL